MTTCDYTVAI